MQSSKKIMYTTIVVVIVIVVIVAAYVYLRHPDPQAFDDMVASSRDTHHDEQEFTKLPKAPEVFQPAVEDKICFACWEHADADSYKLYIEHDDEKHVYNVSDKWFTFDVPDDAGIRLPWSLSVAAVKSGTIGERSRVVTF